MYACWDMQDTEEVAIEMHSLNGGKCEEQDSGAHLSLPFEPVTLAFKDLWYTVSVKGNKKVNLLQGATGYVLPSTMTALMGR